MVDGTTTNQVVKVNAYNCLCLLSCCRKRDHFTQVLHQRAWTIIGIFQLRSNIFNFVNVYEQIICNYLDGLALFVVFIIVENFKARNLLMHGLILHILLFKKSSNTLSCSM